MTTSKHSISLINLFLILGFIILVSSCASIFTSREQEVEITTNIESQITIDSTYYNKSKSIKAILNKDEIGKQIIIKNEEYKDYYTLIFQNNSHNLRYLSYLPITAYVIGTSLGVWDDKVSVVLGIPIVSGTLWGDRGSKAFIYKDIYNFDIDEKYKLLKREVGEKYISIDNLSFASNKENSKFKNWYNYYSYLDEKNNKDIEYTKLDSLGLQYSGYEESLNTILKKCSFIDTINNVFLDNLNTLTLNSKLIGYNLHQGKQMIFGNTSFEKGSFISYQLKTEWIVKNVYNDTLHIDTIFSESGDFSVDFYNKEESNKKAFKDGLEMSLLKELKQLRKLGILQEETREVNFEKLFISKPNKTTSSLNNSMLATVTIKHKNGHGSGFLISNDGYIVTNHHVVNKKTDIKVILSDGIELNAKVVRTNNVIDLALLKIEGKFDYAFELPTEKKFNIGDEVMAIGTPKSLKLGQSVSKGIVSGIRKSNNLNYLQTDIKTNKGNSGGPIVDNSGKLIGVVEYKIFGFGIEGLSFAIPAYDIFKNLGISY